MTQLWSVTCHMGSHSVTCHPTQVNTPRLNPSQTVRCTIYLPLRDGRLSWPMWLVTYRDGLPACRRSPIQVLTRPSVDTLIEANALTTTLRRHHYGQDFLSLCILIYCIFYSPLLKPVINWNIHKINTDANRWRNGYFCVVLHMQYNTMFALVEFLKVGAHFLNVGHRNQLQNHQISPLNQTNDAFHHGRIKTSTTLRCSTNL